jgi:thiamine-phosphate pyrophosphorylase
MMRESITAGAQRVLEGASARARSRGSAVVESIDLLAALVDESESRASTILAEFGLESERLFAILGVPVDFEPEADSPSVSDPTHSDELRETIREATLKARASDRSGIAGTEHLLAAVIEIAPLISTVLVQSGLEIEAIRSRLAESIEIESSSIPLPADFSRLELADPTETVDLARILDASANRAQEGLRVVEDYIRFVLNDPGLTRRVKDVRSRLAAALRGLDDDDRIAARDVDGDVGTHIMTNTERFRSNTRELLTANFKRSAEALRSLEEYAKLVDEWLSGRFEILRYDVYTLEKLTLTAARSVQTLGTAKLYFLIGETPTLGDLTWLVGEALAGGVDVVQLRLKSPPDRVVLERAREIRLMTAASGAKFILNDRPDLARLASADGVHLGQDDVRPRDARRIVGPQALLGVSTHDAEQIERAVLDGAGYLGVGPVFPSGTKEFESLAGLEFVRRAAETTTIPWFAIGGINLTNVDRVIEAGATRIAVGQAISAAEHPRAAARELRDRLESHDTTMNAIF